ncbi:MAG: SRPBCC family protein, partial [Marinirhabdus sp.]
MKYTLKTTIGLPREEVIKKLDNPENMKHWQRGLLHYELLSGAPGEEGTKMLLHYKMGKREIKMTETITKNKFP